MSLLGVAGRPLLPILSPGGAYLVAVRELPEQEQRALLAIYDDLHGQILTVRRVLDITITDHVANAAGFASVIGIGGSTQPANNFSLVALPVAGSTQFTWAFGATEADTTYGIALGLSGPNTLPTVMKFVDRVRLDFGAVTPAGLQADMLLFR